MIFSPQLKLCNFKFIFCLNVYLLWCLDWSYEIVLELPILKKASTWSLVLKSVILVRIYPTVKTWSVFKCFKLEKIWFILENIQLIQLVHLPYSHVCIYVLIHSWIKITNRNNTNYTLLKKRKTLKKNTHTHTKKHKNFAIYLQAVQLHLGPNQLLICVSTFSYISLFNSAGNIFQIRAPKSLTLLSPNVIEFPKVTLRSSLRLLEFTRFPNKLCMQKKLIYL